MSDEPRFYRKANGPQIVEVWEDDGKGPHRHGGLESAKEVEADADRCVRDYEEMAQGLPNDPGVHKRLQDAKDVQARIKAILKKA
jgi:hypothetical protein